MTVAIEVQGLRREYRRRGSVHVGLDGVDLDVPVGEVHGLLGPNGAGKTTLTKILATILTPTSGTARVLGLDVVRDAAAVRRSIGLVLGGDRGLYRTLTARQNLEFWAAMHGIPRRATKASVDAVLERVGLADVAGPVETFSRGMQQRLHLARGLLSEPAVLLLDEPTIGLDPIAAVAFRDLVRDVRARGTTVLLTTHDMAEAEELCNRVTLVDRGRILATERPAALGRLLQAYERVDVVLEAAAADLIVTEALAWEGVTATERTADGARIDTGADGASSDVVRRLLDRGCTRVSVRTPSLAEIYVHLVGDRGLGLG